MNIIIFLLVLAALIFVHELGHFLVAKLFGIRVDEFGLGFPPRLLSFKKGETTYSLNALPFGGFVKIFGEDPTEAEKPENQKDLDRSMVAKPRWIQALVLVGGIVFNLIFAWLLFTTIFMTGSPTLATEENRDQLQNVNFTTLEVVKSSPAEEAGLQAGDKILSIGDQTEVEENLNFDIFSTFVEQSAEAEITIEYQRGAEVLTTTVTPEYDPDLDRHVIGAALSEVGIQKLSFGQALIAGAERTVYITQMIFVGLGQLLHGAFTGADGAFDQVAGPVGIFDIVSQTADTGFAYLLALVALISINLAILNLLPFPALDGGRLFFLLIEAIKGSPIKPQIATAFNLAGFAILILLMLIVTYNDILRLFT